MQKNKDEPRVTSGTPEIEDSSLDTNLRPRKLADFVGQDNTKENLIISIKAALKRGDTLDHVLIYGPPGLGKTTLACIIAGEIGVNIKISSGPAIGRPGRRTTIMTHLHKNRAMYSD